jgi:hypothetical protein
MKNAKDIGLLTCKSLTATPSMDDQDLQSREIKVRVGMAAISLLRHSLAKVVLLARLVAPRPLSMLGRCIRAE